MNIMNCKLLSVFYKHW